MNKMLLIAVAFMVFASACASFEVQPPKKEVIGPLVKQKVMGHWKASSGSQVDFWCNGSVSVDIKDDEIKTDPTGVFQQNRWSGGMTHGTGRLDGFENDTITVHTLIMDQHWKIDSYPKPFHAGSTQYQMQIEGLSLEAGEENLLRCEEVL